MTTLMTDGSQPNTSDKWLLAHHDPLTGLRTFTTCIALADLHGDGESKLVVADLGSKESNMKLKVFKGTSLMSENTLIDTPTGLVTFYMDYTEPRVPAVAVASGAYIYIYKNLRPYFKFTLPDVGTNPVEYDAWNQARDDLIDNTMLYEILDSLRQEVGECGLTTRSQRFLMCSDQPAQTKFINEHKRFILRSQTVVTCIGTLKKNDDQEEAMSCLVLGTEHSMIYILDPKAFIILHHISVPSVPVFLSISGLFDVEYRLVIACRNGFIYTSKRKSKVLTSPTVELTSQPIGLLRRGKCIVVATMDQYLTCYSNKGKKLWSVILPSPITCIESVEIKSLAQELIAVGVDDRRVLIYYDKHLVDTITTEKSVSAMRFGSYGRERNCLILILKGGGLDILILKRKARFDPNPKESSQLVSSHKLNIPKKTKLFVDQTMRERENAVLMHRVFQHDLYRLRLNTARAYVGALKTSSNPVSLNYDEPLKLSAQVLGLGPTFKLRVELQNTSATNPSLHLFIVFYCDDLIYEIQNSYIEVPILVPGVVHIVDTLITCVSDLGASDVVRVFVVRGQNSRPILSAMINMPISEVYAQF